MEKEFDIVDEDLEEVHESHFFRKLFFFIILIIALTVVYARYVGTSGLLVKEYPIRRYNERRSYRPI